MCPNNRCGKFYSNQFYMGLPVAAAEWQLAPGDKVSGWELQKAVLMLSSLKLQGRTFAWMWCQYQVCLSPSEEWNVSWGKEHCQMEDWSKPDIRNHLPVQKYRTVLNSLSTARWVPCHTQPLWDIVWTTSTGSLRGFRNCLMHGASMCTAPEHLECMKPVAIRNEKH